MVYFVPHRPWSLNEHLVKYLINVVPVSLTDEVFCRRARNLGSNPAYTKLIGVLT
jgi:hypothetical protein